MLWCWVWAGQVREGFLEVVIPELDIEGWRRVSETKNTKWRHENRATFVIHKGKGEGGSEKWTRKGRPGPNQYGFFFGMLRD